MSSASIKRTLSQQLLVGVLLATGLSGAPLLLLLLTRCACVLVMGQLCRHLLRICLPLHASPSFHSTSLRSSAAISPCAAAGFARVLITDGSLMNSFAISSALFTIVMTSVVTGTVLPFGLAMAGIDPANAGTTIQVSAVRVCRMHACMHACMHAW
jgi:hypothetical protein